MQNGGVGLGAYRENKKSGWRGSRKANLDNKEKKNENLVIICQKSNNMIKQVLLTMLFVCMNRAIVGYVLAEVFMT